MTHRRGLHPQTAGYLATLDLRPRPASALDVAEVRAAHLAATDVQCSTPPAIARVRDHCVSTGDGDIVVREYAAAGTGQRSATLVYLHGGGWVVGSVDTFDDLCSRLANALVGTVFSVDYRLAPEHPFPVPLLDGEAAVTWVFAEHEQLGIDPQQVFVGGDSAGGALAAAVSRRARDRPSQDWHLAGQLLIYPVTDAAMETPSFRTHGEEGVLTRTTMGWYWDQYAPSHDRTSPDVSPLRASDLSGLPPAVVVVASHDPVRDEGLQYADRLRDAGVPVRVGEARGHVHGFLRWTALLDDALDAIDDIGQALRTGGPFIGEALQPPRDG